MNISVLPDFIKLGFMVVKDPTLKTRIKPENTLHNEGSNNEDSGSTTSAKNNDDTASDISSVSTRAKTKQQHSQASKKTAVKVKDT